MNTSTGNTSGARRFWIIGLVVVLVLFAFLLFDRHQAQQEERAMAVAVKEQAYAKAIAVKLLADVQRSHRANIEAARAALASDLVSIEADLRTAEDGVGPIVEELACATCAVKLFWLTVKDAVTEATRVDAHLAEVGAPLTGAARDAGARAEAAVGRFREAVRKSCTQLTKDAMEALAALRAKGEVSANVGLLAESHVRTFSAEIAKVGKQLASKPLHQLKGAANLSISVGTLVANRRGYFVWLARLGKTLLARAGRAAAAAAVDGPVPVGDLYAAFEGFCAAHDVYLALGALEQKRLELTGNLRGAMQRYRGGLLRATREAAKRIEDTAYLARVAARLASP